MLPSLFINYSRREAPFVDSLYDILDDQGCASGWTTTAWSLVFLLALWLWKDLLRWFPRRLKRVKSIT